MCFAAGTHDALKLIFELGSSHPTFVNSIQNSFAADAHISSFLIKEKKI